MPVKRLPAELRKLIREMSDIYGQAIDSILGPKVFEIVENLRLKMKEGRELDDDALYLLLKKELKALRKYSRDTLFQVVHVYSVYLELINRCEAAYRHQRLQKGHLKSPKKSPHGIIFVFTAHPTEARSQRSLGLIDNIDNLLHSYLSSDEEQKAHFAQGFKHLFKVMLKTSMSTTQSPRVEDEAWHIYSTVLRPNLLQEQVNLFKQGVTVHFRTWVGGDKDGHPYVDRKVMLKSLQLSRTFLCQYLKSQLESSDELISFMDRNAQTKKLSLEHEKAIKELRSLQTLAPSDGKKIKDLFGRLRALMTSYTKEWGDLNEALKNIESLIWLYPALVLPLELREDAEVLASEGAEGKKIRGMISLLASLSQGHDPKWYVRGLVLSMTESAKNIVDGVALIKEYLGAYAIPVVPLFETRHALQESVGILKDLFKKHPEIIKIHQKKWSTRYEVMLGYSDSAKENGTLTSRYLIADTLDRIDKLFQKFDLAPVFFHGSGGSVERGGGSIREQIQWWPKSALNVFKSTVQGEMVARNFGDPLIMRSIVSKVCDEFSQRKKRHRDKAPKAFEKFVQEVNKRYKDFVEEKNFPEFVRQATPYQYLDQLKIGSRPTSRSKNKAEFKLRAIPWVLCWTQTRVLFPTWWGIGSAWDNLPSEEKFEILQYYRKSGFFRSFMNILGFTLTKVELAVFRLYLEQNFSSKEAKDHYEKFRLEYEKTKTFFWEVTGEKEFMWHRPWLGESITYRSALIHPLNLIQLISFEKKDSHLLRESVTGIASGMMTTG